MNQLKLKCSLVICTKDREEDLLRTVQSVLGQTVQPHELVIVDAGKTAGFLQQQIQSMCQGVFPLVYLHSSPGLTRQRNIGIAKSSGDIISFIDDDVNLNPCYIEAMLTTFEKDQANIYGAILSRVVNYPSGRGPFPRYIKDTAIRFVSYIFLLPTLGDGLLKISGFPSLTHHRVEQCVIECLSGCSMSFRKSVFTTCTFDESLGGYAFMEDVDIARQLKANGVAVLYEPASYLEHYPSSANRMGQQNLAKMSVLNHHYLFLKHSTFTVSQILAFVWSILGLVILSLPNSGRRRGTLYAIKQILQAPTKSLIGCEQP